MTEAARAQTYARDVADAMLELRGYRRSPIGPSVKAPREVVDDVFKEIAEADRFYTHCFAQGLSPKVTAQLLQDRIWNRR